MVVAVLSPRNMINKKGDGPSLPGVYDPLKETDLYPSNSYIARFFFFRESRGLRRKLAVKEC